MSSVPDPQTDSPLGLAYGMSAYVLWGTLALYMKALSDVAAPEIIAHRIVWSLPVAGAVLVWQGRQAEVVAALRRPRLLAMAGLSALLVSTNWLIYVWAITHGHALDAALGYYINPLFSVLLGAAVLGERLSRWQLVAVALAAAAVLLLTVQAGRLPLVAVGLTFSWGIYGFCKKRLPLGPNQGFTLEVLMLLPLAAGYLLWLGVSGTGLRHDAGTWALLLGCGPVTAIPLLLYANGAKLIRLSSMGILQYVTPTMVFLFAVLLFGEPFEGARLVAFPMIWAALAIYSATLLYQARARRRDRRLAAATRRMQ